MRAAESHKKSPLSKGRFRGVLIIVKNGDMCSIFHTYCGGVPKRGPDPSLREKPQEGDNIRGTEVPLMNVTK